MSFSFISLDSHFQKSAGGKHANVVLERHTAWIDKTKGKQSHCFVLHPVLYNILDVTIRCLKNIRYWRQILKSSHILLLDASFILAFPFNCLHKTIKSLLLDSVLYSTIPKPKIDFREIAKPFVKSNDLVRIDDIIWILLIEKLEFNTRGQSNNETWIYTEKELNWFKKVMKLKQKLKKIEKGGGST